MPAGGAVVAGAAPSAAAAGGGGSPSKGKDLLKKTAFILWMLHLCTVQNTLELEFAMVLLFESSKYIG